MKILCFLDSEHYTDPEYIRVSDKAKDEDIREYVERKLHQDMAWEKGRDHEGEIEWESGKRATAREFTGGDEFFIVCEIKSLPDHDYISGYHHAYDGVSFEVYGFDSIKEAREFSNKAADDFRKGLKVYQDDRSLNSITIDDDNEWHIWTSQLIHETSVNYQMAAA